MQRARPADWEELGGRRARALWRYIFYWLKKRLQNFSTQGLNMKPPPSALYDVRFHKRLREEDADGVAAAALASPDMCPNLAEGRADLSTSGPPPTEARDKERERNTHDRTVS